MPLLWPARRYVSRANPQGVIAAALGSYCVNEATSTVYQKQGGGATQYGWYPIFGSNGSRNACGYSARFQTGTPIFQEFNMPVQALNVGAGGALNGGYLAPRQRPWIGGYTSAVTNTGNVVINTGSAKTVVQANTTDNADGGLNWDYWIWLFTTPRATSGSTATTLNNIRIVAGMCIQGSTIAAGGGLVNTDTTLKDLFPGSWGLSGSQFALMFRYSTGVPDPGWVLASTNEDGAAYHQSVTAKVADIAASTAYKLRIRYIAGALGSCKAYASVNDGAEVLLTNNVGPGTSSNVTQSLVPYVFVQALANELKSLLVSEMSLTWGTEA